MSVNLATKARLHVGRLIVGNPNSDGSLLAVGQKLSEQGETFAVTSTVNPGGILTASVYSTTVTVTGARAGDEVAVIPPVGIIAGVTWSAYVSANDTVTLRIANPTVGTITPVSASWKFLLRKQF